MTEIDSIKREGSRRIPRKVTAKVKEKILKKYESELQSGKRSGALLSSLAKKYGKSGRQIQRYIKEARAARVSNENIEQNSLIAADKRRHYEAVWQVAREWSKQIYYYEYEDDFGSRKLFPTKFKSVDRQR